MSAYRLIRFCWHAQATRSRSDRRANLQASKDRQVENSAHRERKFPSTLRFSAIAAAGNQFRNSSRFTPKRLLFLRARTPYRSVLMLELGLNINMLPLTLAQTPRLATLIRAICKLRCRGPAQTPRLATLIRAICKIGTSPAQPIRAIAPHQPSQFERFANCRLTGPAQPPRLHSVSVTLGAGFRRLFSP
jgi:hypothetical protein